MPHHQLETLSRTISFQGRDVVIVRPGIAFILYSSADLASVMSATAEVLIAYLDYVPPSSVIATFRPGVDEYTPGRWVQFDENVKTQLILDLRSGRWSEEDEGYSFVLSATADGQAGGYGVSFGGIDLSGEMAEETETSLLRLEFPCDLPDSMDMDSLFNFFARTAEMFPYCSGNAGMSFIHTVSWIPEARETICKLLPRFLGFEPSHDSAQLEMRGKCPAAHWLNLLDWDLVSALGGEEKLRSDLDCCEIQRLESGILIRAAKFPPIIDVNRGGRDIGCLPSVARVLSPIRFDEALFAGLGDTESGKAWLERFDNLVSRDWNNH